MHSYLHFLQSAKRDNQYSHEALLRHWKFHHIVHPPLDPNNSESNVSRIREQVALIAVAVKLVLAANVPCTLTVRTVRDIDGSHVEATLTHISQ